MEIVGLVLAKFLECISAPIMKCWKYHSGINKNMVTLKKRLEELNCRKGDIEARLNTELVSGETMLKNEVELWLARVESINVEIKIIEEKVEKLKFFSRVDFGRNVILKTEQVQELCKIQGEFSSSLVISLPKRGDSLPTTTILGGSETTSKRNMEEIWASLMDDEVTKIGVYGMGGIGKTTVLEHINNRILEHINNCILEKKNKFDTVIWVTVSKDSDLTNLQDKIAYKLRVDISKDNDKITRAAELQKKFITKKRFVLILDDLWEIYSLKEVGIPEPTLENGCKLVLSTRSLDVCRCLSCKPIRIDLLPEDEALDLFLDTVGRSVLSEQNLEVIVKEIVKECSGLPLAVVITAGSLKGITDHNEWEVALEDLRKATKGSTSDGIFARLKFSYDQLENKNLQDCLLYCSLYPDGEIEREFLIEHLLVEGIIEEKNNTREYAIKKGQVMLNKLVNACLLNDTVDSNGVKCVKMHDLVRDMALRITTENHRAFVKAGLRLKSIPSEEHWKYDVAKVSLIDNDIIEIPPSVKPPNCPTLSTLFLCQNKLGSISDTFFLHMKGLNLLDLSYNSTLKKLPESISDLVGLTALFLRGCRSLNYVPSLAKLGELRKLDCANTGIDEVPAGIEMLVKLNYLNFDETSLNMIPDGILCKLTNLQYLSFYRHILEGCNFGCPDTWLKLRANQLENMRKVELFGGVICDVNKFNTLVRSFEQQNLVSYVLQLGFIDNVWSTRVNEGGKAVYLTYYNTRESANVRLLLPEDVEFLGIHNCRIDVRNLCELTSFNNVTKLKECSISCCDEIEHVFFYSPSIFPLLQSLEKLFLDELQDLQGLICRERRANSPLPPATFSSLTHLCISRCDRIKRLILTASLPNLENVSFDYCKQLKEIIFMISYDDDNDDDGDQIEEVETDHHAINIVTLHRLRKVELSRLPELQSISVVADSLQEIKLWNCPKLKRIPLLDRQPCPPSLQRVYIDDELWESLEWDHLNTKNVVQSLREKTKMSN